MNYSKSTSPDMRVLVRWRTVYGRSMIYPANETARKLVELLGRKTFDRRDLEKIINLGFHIDWTLEAE